eukprot:TRINITY_DN12137_c0_g5_i1.p1 TRINITY_DN12137_c0_g5~~TRINITY_DN12137_c0_g5_i1.p1  ORF type:complete len:266 (-),score=42.52 TRINITY_DN12137_c0_g5_i1:122-919(-)
MRRLNEKSSCSNYYQNIDVKRLFNRGINFKHSFDIADSKVYLNLPLAKKSSIFDSYRRIIFEGPLKSLTDENLVLPSKDGAKKESIEKLNKQAYELLYNRGKNRPNKALAVVNKSVQLKNNQKFLHRKLKRMAIRNHAANISLKGKIASALKPIINTIQIPNVSIVKNSRTHKARSLHASLIENPEPNTIDRFISSGVYPKQRVPKRCYMKNVKSISKRIPMIETLSIEKLEDTIEESADSKEKYYPPITPGAIIIKNKYGKIIE